jgi:flagellar motor switch protein FliN/FliY
MLSVEDILRLREGSIIQLDKDAGAPVDIYVNNRLVAEGEVLVLNDYFCVRVTNILSSKERAISQSASF